MDIINKLILVNQVIVRHIDEIDEDAVDELFENDRVAMNDLLEDETPGDDDDTDQITFVRPGSDDD